MVETVVAGLPIPSTSPLFLGMVGAHVGFALVAITAGAVAMLSRKGPGRHHLFGSIYFWALAGVAVTAGGLAAARWPEDLMLLALAILAFGTAVIGRAVRRRLSPGWARLHVLGMGLSYVVMLVAFYVDNGKNLPVWRELPPLAYWAAPMLVGLPIIAFAMLRHPLMRAAAEGIAPPGCDGRRRNLPGR